MTCQDDTASSGGGFQTDPKACLLITTLLSMAQKVPPLFSTTLLLPPFWYQCHYIMHVHWGQGWCPFSKYLSGTLCAVTESSPVPST